MSGLPDEEGVQRVLNLMEREEGLLAELEQLRATVAPLQQMQARLTQVEKEIVEATNMVGLLLEKMDVSSPGNYGFGNRMGWFLAEMRRRIRKTALKECAAQSGALR